MIKDLLKNVNSKIEPTLELNEKIKNTIRNNSNLRKGFFKPVHTIALLLIFVLTTFIVFNVNNKYTNEDGDVSSDKISNINKKNIIEVNAEIDIMLNLADNKVMYEHSKNIAIIKIEAIEGVSNYNIIAKEYTNPFTYGKAKILFPLKGDFKNNTFNFKRLGGTLPFNEWIKGEPNKTGFGEIQNPENVMIKYNFENDIDIETGKTYLAYLTSDEYINSEDFYITGFQYGLREIKTDYDNIDINTIKNLQVKNNLTKNWEKITDIIPFTK